MTPERLSTLLLMVLTLLFLSGCGSRQVQDSLAGSSAQRLVTLAIDELVTQLPDDDFAPLRGQRLWLDSHFFAAADLQRYADQRLRVELARRWAIEAADSQEQADIILTVFYTSLGTDQGHLGFSIPLGVIPGVDDATRINLITLEQFHGIAELYYYLGPSGNEHRGPRLQARKRNDALGLPVITIPVSTVD
ncbi:MAG: hypothetical protein ACXIUL_03380 [Wenzhouxiangella sp.]